MTGQLPNTRRSSQWNWQYAVQKLAVQSALFDVPSGPGRSIGKRLTLLESGDRRAVFFGPTAIHVYDRGDKAAEAACVAILARAGLASDVDWTRRNPTGTQQPGRNVKGA